MAQIFKNSFNLTVFILILASVCSTAFVKPIRVFNQPAGNSPDSLQIADSLIHRIKLTIYNRLSLKSTFNNDYLFNKFDGNKDSIICIETKIYKHLLNEPRMATLNLKDSFHHLHRQYLTFRRDSSDYLVVYYYQFKSTVANANSFDSKLWNYLIFGINSPHIRKQFYTIYPLNGNGQISLTTLYF